MASQDFLQEYVEEVREHLQELEDSLLVLERDGTNKEQISHIFRAAHSIKGASAYMGFERLAGLTHELESFISEIQTQSRPVPPGGISTLLECIDFISNALGHVQETGEEPPLPSSLLENLCDVRSSTINGTNGQTATDSTGMGPVSLEEEVDALFLSISPDEEEPASQSMEDEHPDLLEVDQSCQQDVEIKEDDEELFGIFLNSFQENFSQLADLSSVPSQAFLSDADIEQAHNLLKRLIASSQYMDYDQIVDILREWEESLLKFYQSGTADGKLYTELLRWHGPRLERLLPGLTPFTDSSAAQDEVSDGGEAIQEEDQELFAIFLDSFQQHLADLLKVSSAPSDAVLSRADFEKARDLIRKMISSCQYMDYDQLVVILQEWEGFLLGSHQGGQLSGFRYSEVFEAHTKRLQRILPMINASPMPAGSDDSPAMDLFDREVDVSFEELREVCADSDLSPEDGPQEEHEEYKEVIPVSGKEFVDKAVEPPETGGKKGRISAVAEEVPSSATLRVDAQKVDQLLNQVGELVVTRSEFIQTAASFRDMLRDLSAQGKLSKQDLRRLRSLNFRLNESTLSLGRVANDLQSSVMRVRMLPIAQLFQRFPRVVRDQGIKLGKKVDLVVDGGETEIDKRVLEQMNDPLVQFLRNAIVHGIESPEERRLARKPEVGTIRLAAYHEGDYVAIEIEDDGRGIDTQKLKGILQTRKGLSPQEMDRLSEHEMMYAIFLPGISTHDRVDGTAGRGVGLDVVKENLERMNGTIEVESFAGTGTRFTIRIPLTVAIIRALLVTGANQVFALPLSSVSEILRYEQEKTHSIEGFQVISLRGRTIPLIHLSQLLNMRTFHPEKSHKFIVIVTTSFREVGLVVDGLMGEREVVIKPIEDEVHAFEGFSGATILGDGTVALILDVSALLRITKNILNQYSMPDQSSVH